MDRSTKVIYRKDKFMKLHAINPRKLKCTCSIFYTGMAKIKLRNFQVMVGSIYYLEMYACTVFKSHRPSSCSDSTSIWYGYCLIMAMHYLETTSDTNTSTVRVVPDISKSLEMWKGTSSVKSRSKNRQSNNKQHGRQAPFTPTHKRIVGNRYFIRCAHPH